MPWHHQLDLKFNQDFFLNVGALRGRHLGVQLLGQAVKYARRQGLDTLRMACPEELRGYFAQYGFTDAGKDIAMDLRRRIQEIP